MESGTGKVEVLKFVVYNKHYAINILKIKEVLEIKPGSVTKLPDSVPSIWGLILYRN